MADAPMFGRTVLVSGPETLLVDRAVEAWEARVHREQPDLEINDVLASDLDAGQLAELTGGSLFATESALVLRDLANLPADLADAVVALGVDTPADVAVVMTHLGGQKGTGVVNKLKKARCEVIAAAAIKPWELPQFVAAEAKRLGVRIDQEAAEALVGGVGHDPRALAGALQQLLSDAGDEPLSATLVRRYFAGRAEVTSFAVADDVLVGATNGALEKLRWALSTGVAPVLVTSALANSLRSLGRYNGVRSSGMREAEMAAAIGVPPWKIKDLRSHSRRWSDRRIADGIRLVAQADADIKGQAGSPDFTLERLVLALAEG